MLAKPEKKVSPLLVAYSLAVLGGEAYCFYLLNKPSPKVKIRWQNGDAPDGTSPPPHGAEDWPFVSIIVPARNEERNLPRLLPSLLQQDYPRTRYEVIVVDDQSTDSSPEILRELQAEDPRLRVVQGTPLPEGWKGKPWAMKQGVDAAQGEIFLFTDADTVHHPAMLTSTVSMALEQEADLFTVSPYLETVSPPERLVMPVTMMGIYFLYPPAAINDPKSKIAIANGQFIMVRRETYEEVGGIDAVRADIAEDLEFGRLVKRRGHRLYAADGRDLLRVRMYTNMSELWEGWRKNVLLSFKKQPFVGVQSLFMIAGVFYPFGGLLRRGFNILTGRANSADKVAFLLFGAQAAGFFAIKRRFDRNLDLPAGWAFTFPAGLFVFTLILLDSFRLLITGRGVSWKGRTYTE